MPTSVATHASLLLKAAAAKPFFYPRAAARIPAPSPHPHPPPPPPAARRLPTTAAALAAAARRFRWPSAARGLCAAPHSGGDGMGSDAGVGARKRPAPAVNALAKDVPAVNGKHKEEPAPAPPRLLTLPTVLTIGRVVAVPLLISSKLINPVYYFILPFSPCRCFCWSDHDVLRRVDTGSCVSCFGAFRLYMW